MRFVAHATLLGFVFLVLLTAVALLQSADQSGGNSTGWVTCSLCANLKASTKKLF
jgi:heme/copper-type cytochrome/quinol oxidase subunit 4